jgi:hypothetical protein
MSACTAIAPLRHKNCTRIAKIAPCFAHYGSGGIIIIASLHSPPPFDSAPQTPFIAGPLAVICDILLTREYLSKYYILGLIFINYIKT